MKAILLLGMSLLVFGFAFATQNTIEPYAWEPVMVSGGSVDLSSITEDSPVSSEGENGCSCADPEIAAGIRTFSFSVINCHSLDWLGAGNNLRGLDHIIYADEDAVMSPRDSVYFVSLDDGSKILGTGLHSDNDQAYGCYACSGITVSDWQDNDLYFTDNMGVTWNTFENPAGSEGRGMDMDYNTNTVWETCNTSTIYSFAHSSGSGTAHDVSSVITDQMSGLAVYNNGDDNWLLINTYNSECAYIFDLDDNLNFLGTAAYPYSSTFFKSYGVTYTDIRDTFLWSYKDNSDNCYLVELELVESALQQTTWGSIKSVF